MMYARSRVRLYLRQGLADIRDGKSQHRIALKVRDGHWKSKVVFDEFVCPPSCTLPSLFSNRIVDAKSGTGFGKSAACKGTGPGMLVCFTCVSQYPHFFPFL